MTRTAHILRMPLVVGTMLLGTSLAFAQAPEPEAQARPEGVIMPSDASPAGGAAAPGATGGPPPPGATAEAAPPLDATKTWPCVQRKVETMSASQVWDGPPIDELKGWFRDPQISALIDVVASRRVSVEQAEAAIKKFADAQPEAERDAKLSLLFAGIFDKMTGHRRSILAGIEKYQKSQIARSQELEKQSTSIAQLESKRDPNATDDTPELAEAREKFNWAQRIFQERQSSIPLACELPVLLEERLYALSRAIRGNMKS